MAAFDAADAGSSVGAAACLMCIGDIHRDAEREAEAIERIAQAKGEVAELNQLLNGTEGASLLRARLYRERLSRIFSDVGSIRFIAPPKTGMRITIQERP